MMDPGESMMKSELKIALSFSLSLCLHGHTKERQCEDVDRKRNLSINLTTHPDLGLPGSRTVRNNLLIEPPSLLYSFIEAQITKQKLVLRSEVLL